MRRLNLLTVFSYVFVSLQLTHFYHYIIAIQQELLPFLTDGMDDEDEFLLAVATSLGRMVPLKRPRSAMRVYPPRHFCRPLSPGPASRNNNSGIWTPFRLCCDETPMVCHVAARHLGRISCNAA
jgi:hypothetical protein